MGPSHRTVAFVLLLLAAPGAQAADLIVTRHDDPPPDGCAPGDCSLREAVIAANATTDLDVIHLFAGTYGLTTPNPGGVDDDASLTGDLDLAGPVALVGPGATMTTIDGNGIDRVIEVLLRGGTTVDLAGISFRGGEAVAAAGILARSGVHMDHCELRDNGLDSGSATIAVTTTGELFLERSTIADNGGIGVQVLQGEALLENVTISGNLGSELRVSDDGELTCRHCTVADAVHPSPQLAAFDGGLLDLANSIVAGSVNASCSTDEDSFIDSLGGNLEAPGTSCHLDEADDEDGVPPSQLLLGRLQHNGGPTRTHLPGAASHAIDTARDATCAATDQRGADRPDTLCDRGAVERGATAPPTPLFLDGFEEGYLGAWAGSSP